MSDSDVKRGAAIAGLCAVIVLLAVAAALAGCAVGPNYVKPATPVAATFAGAGDAAYGTDEAQAKFWTQFGDPTLDQLVDDALARQPRPAHRARSPGRGARAAARGAV